MLSNHKLMFVFMLGVCGAVMWTTFSPAALAREIVGAAIALPALVLWFLARRELGTSFAIRAQARTLVTTGVYSRIRNPVYVFGALFMLGLIIYVGLWPLLAIFIVIIPLQVYRAQREQSVLEAKFGDEYRQYRARTWF